MDSINFDTNFWKQKLILIDSRKLIFPAQSIFFAIKGKLNDGHRFIDALYQQGVRHFVVSESISWEQYPMAQVITTPNVIQLLQDYAHYHRKQFDLPVVAITGSNGKTILKEWLFQLLEQDYTLIKSPKSYNSQIGVPLSVLAINGQHNLAIFEAGISKVGEMERLQKVITPTIGIFTNIGKAHASGFANLEEKIEEKLLLFKGVEVLIYSTNHSLIHQKIRAKFKHTPTRLWSWGASTEAQLPIYTQIRTNKTLVQIHWEHKITRMSIPFTNAAAIENCLHTIATLLYLGIPIQQLEQRMEKLSDVPMRLELKEGIHNSQIIDDSYNNDLEGLKIALDFLQQKHKTSSDYSKTLILSDIPELKKLPHYQLIGRLLQEHQIKKLIGIGPHLMQAQHYFKTIPETYFFETTDAFIAAIGSEVSFYQESILLKGARAFGFERIAQQLKQRIHGTVLEINLEAVTNNLQIYKNQLNPKTKLMVMVKASAYGSGSYEIAQLLQYNHVDYLGVAYVDEGVALRSRGIQLPIMVMNSAAYEFEILCKNRLEPVVYSFSMLKAFLHYLTTTDLKTPYPIHLELDTGMHRLGFVEQDIPNVLSILSKHKKQLNIKGIFSHLAASDTPQHEAFSKQQIDSFAHLANHLETTLEIKAIKHLLNSAGITRFPQHQFDMVRLGIGLYGIDPNQQLPLLQNVVCLKTSIAQIKTLDTKETVGYSRKGTLEQVSRIAVLSIGYADGFLRAFGNGNAQVKIHGQLAPTIGNICMDMCFVDVSHISAAQEGDEVILFDNVDMIQALATTLETIPYEILTNISDRVPRIFYEA
ncbi:bifunctional UDP-N-acetylmuramoyl-tripeptide:D-alanyl-D-alanine ligase/alanine racemase [Aureispira sp. CCB-E]|uniref:bifunctional UDP-N-acetylmuramoyl-tripeptide:D-alanyl-D-alanine ligase/alanine racemase n=1 Tax=Aureispira sp. CCB-E TaxID=3051121 RepID=UPI002868688E|nr:bifunctional UDP-N-acetylmuramoyl-tripeptide:D-alanyl-D-alanine ligase/alanine racemase [Aureispira sp. CCB-E]WMX16888.1 bifunctional UDP-N-acetylmuramoyl-tripeptide:D-alanyl-D-alanine ligase/alanine racemase [Aureispira sp. CCB-E]